MFFPHVFEADIYPTLKCVPMSLRRVLDLAGIKVHLRTWAALPVRERWDLACHPYDTEADRAAFASRVVEAVRRVEGGEPERLPVVARPGPWERPEEVPAEVAERGRREGLSVSPEEWAAFHPQRRFALWKLACARHESENFVPALREFRDRLAEPPPAAGSPRAACLDGAIVAGGRSRRFGSDKTRLEVDGETLLARTARVLGECGFRRIWVVGGEATGRSPSLSLRVNSLPVAFDAVRFLPDDVPDLGPACGIATALLRAPMGVFAVAADMPALSADVVRAVVAAWDGRAPAAVPWRDGRWEPLCGVYLRDALPPLYRAVGEQRRSLQEALTELSAQRVRLGLDVAVGLINVNTPQEWKRYRTALDHSRRT